MNRRRGVVTQSLTFDEVLAMVACPYCRAAVGAQCWRNGRGHLLYPHKSRGKAALAISRADAHLDAVDFKYDQQEAEQHSSGT